MKRRLVCSLVVICLVAGLGVWLVALNRQSDDPPEQMLGGVATEEGLSPASPEESVPASPQVTGSNKAGAPDSGPPPVDLPEHIKAIIANKNAYPSFEALSALSTNDESALVALYSSEMELTNKRALTWAFVAVGREAAAQALLDTVNEDHQRQQLALPAWEVMRDTVAALGFAAAYSQPAYDFLVAASSENYWERNRTWRSTNPREEAYTNIRYAGLAIHGVGLSLRPEVPSFLEKLRAREEATGYAHAASILEAAFYYDIGTQRGRDALVSMYLRGTQFAEYLAWSKTENGQAWKDWATKGQHAR